MKSALKPFTIVLFLMTLATFSKAQHIPKIDESNLVTQLMGFSSLNQVQADSYLTSKQYAVSSKSTKSLGAYDADFIKYKLSGGTDSYSIVLVKGKIINTMYITYSKDTYLKAVDDALKAGFKVTEAASPDPAQTVYAMGDTRFIVRTNSAKDKTFYVLGLSNLVITAKAIAEAKSK
jgi:hypothetical protein